ncbi:uncharacterized protein METZ01_LOCUS93629 [marine metagenome]|uniref:Uncharacterized protein n=1 Tax=marine metagenome TaxID=408172 RepID=A0A381VK98_9ZZZZ
MPSTIQYVKKLVSFVHDCYFNDQRLYNLAAPQFFTVRQHSISLSILVKYT